MVPGAAALNVASRLGSRGGTALAPGRCMTPRSDIHALRRRRAVKIAVAALVGVPWIPLAAALYAWLS